MNVANLYPKVEFPVSRGTPMISSKIKWDHSESWFVTSHAQVEIGKSAERIIKLNIGSPEFEFIVGHMIDGNLKD
jgi:fatty acid synthase